MIKKFPNAEISISIVWIRMLQGDSEVTANKSADIFNDPRVRQFYDPDQRSAKAIAESIGCEGKVAWDFYLFYAAGSEWIENPPKPTYWMHQLRESWVDPKHFYKGEDLVKELFMTMKRLLSV